MQAGSLRHRLALQTATESADADGAMERSWATTTTVWGSVEPAEAGGVESQIAGEPTPIITHRVTIRYISSSAPTPKQRFLFGSRILDIMSVHSEENRIRRSTVCYCREVQT